MILFLHGADTFRSRQKLKEIKDKFIKEVDPQGYNLSLFVGKDTEIKSVIDALLSSPFMAEKRMVVLEELSQVKLSDKEQESFIDLMDQVIESDTIFVIWEAGLGKRDLKKKLFTAVQKTKFVFAFEGYNSQQIAGWMSNELQQQGISINPHALQYLSLAVEENLWKASSEVQKLIAYVQAKGLNEISVETVSLLVSGGSANDVFALVDAVSQGRGKEAMKLLHDQFANGSHELELLGMLMRQFRLIQQIKDGLNMRLAPDQIAKQFGIHPFVVKKMTAQANSFSQEDIQEAYHLLVDLDKSIKSSGLKGTVLTSIAVGNLSK